MGLDGSIEWAADTTETSGISSLHSNEAKPGIPAGRRDRVLVLAPHPDDEVLATGGLIQQASRGGFAEPDLDADPGGSGGEATCDCATSPASIPRREPGVGRQAVSNFSYNWLSPYQKHQSMAGSAAGWQATGSSL
jgi:hypothetical protein